nr:unnamed protein product [Callosobruchus chinensis]
MAEIYYPEKEPSIDESMVLWRGRLMFRQYIQGKRHKYGVKLYVLAEPIGMVQKILVYGGSADPDVGGKKHTEKVVHSLMEEKKGAGHSLYMDNFYNSVYTTGTLRANRAGNPKEVISKKLNKGETCGKYTNKGLCVSKWKDKREVLAISKEFGDEQVTTISKRGIEKGKPRLIVEYNKFMMGVDQYYHMMSYYSCEHKTLRWYKKLGIHIFQLMLINSHYLYNKFSRKTLNLYDFRLAILESLLPPPAKPEKQPIHHLPEYCPKDKNGKAKRRRCKYCWEVTKIRKDTVGNQKKLFIENDHSNI